MRRTSVHGLHSGVVVAVLVLAATVLGTAVLSTSRPGPTPAAAIQRRAAPPSVQFTDTRLTNGLRVIVSEDHTAPVFSIAITHDVGSRNERKGRTGVAHLVEHMMFKGSANVGSGEHFLLVFNNGGGANGSTSKDRTNYYERLPANQLELALFLEADRMRSLDINQANLDNQVSTVSEERKHMVDNQPYGRTTEALEELAYTSHPYKHSVYGSPEDLAAATVDDVAAFFKTYYAPNNAVLAIVGDVQTDLCLARVRHYFESIPRQPPPKAVVIDEPPQTAERRQTLDDPLAQLPRLDMVYHIPGSLTPDHDALSVLATVLSGGRSSRFYEGIVRQKQLSSNVTASAGESRGPGLFRIRAVAAPGRSVADLEQAIHEEVERVKAGPIERWEIGKAQDAARRGFVDSVDSTLSKAVVLSQLAVFYGDPNLINTRYERLSAITAADVQRVAGEYLVPANRSVVITNPKPAAAAGEKKGVPQAATPPAGGQASLSKGVVIKGKAPVSNEILTVKVPRPAEVDLANGVHLMVLEDRRLPQITMQIIIPGAGDYYDPPDAPGLAGLTAANMAEGTTSRTAQQIAEEQEAMAASVGVSAGGSDAASGEFAMVSAASLTDSFDKVLALAADILLNPSFPTQELERHKTRRKASLVQARAVPISLAMERFYGVIYGDHPAGRQPTAASIDKTTRESLAAFHRAHYVPDETIVAVVGDISLADARKKVQGALGGWKEAGVTVPPVRDPNPVGSATISVVDRPNSLQTMLIVGTQVIARTSPDYDVVSLLNAVIGGGPTGRLFLNLREEKGWTSGAFGVLNAPGFLGEWSARTGVRSDVAVAAVGEMLMEIERLRSEPIPDRELVDKKRSLVANFALSLEAPAVILSCYITSRRYGLPADYWDKYPERVMAITREQIQSAAKKYLDPGRIQVVAVGDASKIAAGLEKFGTVEVYDTEGRIRRPER